MAPKIGERVFVFCKVPLPLVDKAPALDRRIAHILSGQATRKLDLRRKALLRLAGVATLGTTLALGVVRGATGAIQAAKQAPTSSDNITGTWQGRGHVPAAPISASC